MITIFGEGRGFRIVWLLEEMGLPYRLRPVDLGVGADKDPEFMAINPGGFIPAMRDGDVTMVKSIAIMEYLMARHGPTNLAPQPADPNFRTTNSFCGWAKRAWRRRSIMSSARAISRPRISAGTGPPVRRSGRSKAACAWSRGSLRAFPIWRAKISPPPISPWPMP